MKKKSDEEIFQGEFGKVQDAEHLIRHQYLSQFFQLIGLDEQQAE